MPSDIVCSCVKKLIEANMTIAFAETASAGRLIFEFAQVLDVGDILLGSIVTYNRQLKEDLLQIPPELIDTFTAESAQVTKAMAQSLQNIVNADISVALTGLSTPGASENAEKPVGTIFITIIQGDKTIEEQYHFAGSSGEIVLKSVDAVSQLILDKVIPE